MAVALEVMIIDGGDRTIKVQHTFYGLTEREARGYYREHESSCTYFASAVREGRVIEEIEEMDDDELPTEADYEDDEDE
jgi:hypothetical protein